MRRSAFRRRPKRDANHGEIAAALTKAGRTVVDLSGVGGGCPDALVGWSGKMLLMEFKTEDGHDEDSQIEFRRWWHGTPVVIVRSVAEALAATGVRV